MLARDVPGFGVFFGIFELNKNLFGVYRLESDPATSSPTPELVLRKFLAGGFTGVTSWIFAYPLDTLKSQMQVETGSSKLIPLLRKTVKEQGFFRLYRGITVMWLRSFPTAATSLLFFESIRNHLLRVSEY